MKRNRRINKGVLVTLIVLLLLAIPSAIVTASTRYEYYTTGSDSVLSLYDTYWKAQTFTPSTAHTITSVYLMMYREGSPGTVTVGIRDTSGGLPTGSDLCSGTYNGNSLTTDTAGAWYEVTFGSGYSLSAATKYAIVVRAPSGTIVNRVFWKTDQSSPTYSGGSHIFTSNGGSSWTEFTDTDFMFEEWGGVPPAAPTNIAASDATYTDKVVITWTKSSGATDYQVYRDGVGQGWIGDVATYDDTGANAPYITAGSSIASDGTYINYVALSLSGTSAHDGNIHAYRVKAKNAYGESSLSSPNYGRRGVGTLIYQWQRSSGDSDSGYSNIVGATTANYNDSGAPADGSGRYYRCYLTATGATSQYSVANRGYRATASSPSVTTDSSSGIDDDSATLAGTITSTGGDTVTVRGFKYGLTQTDTWDVHENGSFSTGSYSLSVSSLSASTTYWYRAYATNGEGTGYGSWKSFETLGVPIMTTLDASLVATTTARLNSGITDDGGDDVTIRFGWGLTSESAIEDYDHYETVAGTYNTGEHPYLDIDSLTPGQTYYFRVEGTNIVGSDLGDELTFETESGITAPSNFVGYARATSISLTWEKGTGTTNSMVRYNHTTYPTNTTAGDLVYSGTSSSYTHTGLTPGTTYYYSVWGESGGDYTDYVTLMMTTSASTTGGEDFSPPTEPSRWLSAPDYTNLSGLLMFYDGMNGTADALNIPRATFWMIMAIGLSFLMAALFYLIANKEFLVGAIVLTVCLAFGWAIQLIPFWIPLIALIMIIASKIGHREVEN